MNSYRLKHKSRDVKRAFEEKVKARPEFVRRRLTNTGFHIESKKKFDGQTMVEKPFYRVQGKFKKIGQETDITYKVRGNGTFSVVAVVIGVQIIPMVAIPLLADNQDQVPYIVIGLLALIAFVIYLLLQSEKGLRKKGERVFEQFLQDLDSHMIKTEEKALE